MLTRREKAERKRALRREMLMPRDSGAASEPVMLPPVRELANRHGLSTRTVYLEIQSLVSEGTVYTVPRVGSFVSARTMARNEAALNSGTKPQPVLTVIAHGDGEIAPGHRQYGWADHLNWGLMCEIRNLRRHAMILELDQMDEYGFEELGKTPDAVIVCNYDLNESRAGKLIRDLLRRGIRVVTYGDEEENCDVVTSDHAEGAYQLARWLQQSGRRNILFAQPVLPATRWLSERYAGYVRAMSEDGHNAAAPVVYPISKSTPGIAQETVSSFQKSVQSIARTLRPHLTGKDAADAIMVVSDGDVSRVAAACRACGRKPNEDIALVGYDNYWQDSMALVPEPFAPLATVDKFNRELGSALVTLLVERLEGRLPITPQRRVIMPKLVEIKHA